MKDESIKEARRYLIECILNYKGTELSKQDILEIAIWIHHLYQPETYKDNGKALQKVLNKKNNLQVVS